MKLEIKSIGAVSAFKALIYMMLPLILLFMIIGTFMTLLGSGEIRAIGIIYIIIMPILMVVFYGPLTMLVAVIYSKLAQSFGGLVITVDDLQVLEMATSNEVITES